MVNRGRSVQDLVNRRLTGSGGEVRSLTGQPALGQGSRALSDASQTGNFLLELS
jgi:hypothetical protein